MLAISIVVVSTIIYGIILEKRNNKEFKDGTRFHQKWVSEFFHRKSIRNRKYNNDK